jgi:hypothetical protein
VFNLQNEAPISLEAAAKAVKTHFSTVFRWALKGCRAPDGTVVRLEALRLGGRWVTSHEAVQRFALALTPCLEATPTPRSAGKRQKASERAGRELEKLGI